MKDKREKYFNSGLIVGLGASAGGPAAFTGFCENLSRLSSYFAFERSGHALN